MISQFKTDLQQKSERVLTRQNTHTDGDMALAAFRDILRTPLGGQDYAARFVVVMANGERKALYYSHFNRPFGQSSGRGRIHPDAPLRADLSPFKPADQARADELAGWLPANHGGRVEFAAAASGHDLSRSSANLIVKWLGPLAERYPEDFAKIVADSATESKQLLELWRSPEERSAVHAAQTVISRISAQAIKEPT